MQKNKVKIADEIISLMILNRLKNKGGITFQRDLMLAILFDAYRSGMIEKFMHESMGLQNNWKN